MHVPGAAQFSAPPDTTNGTVPPSVIPMAPKDELLDVIRTLQNEKESARENGTDRAAQGAASDVNGMGGLVDAGELKPNWHPMTVVLLSVPHLPRC